MQVSRHQLVTAFALLLIGSLSVSSADAQTTTRTTGTSGATGTAAAGTTGTTGSTGSLTGGNAIDPASLFSSTTGDSGTSFGQLGANDGRFATSALQNAPTATSPTGATGQTTQGRTTNRTTRSNQQFNRGGNNAFQQQFNRQFGGRSTTTRTVRPSLRLGFVPPPRPQADLKTTAATRFTSVSNRAGRIADTNPAFQGVEVAVADNGVVTLTGSVPSEAAGRLAANMLRMEPGVRTVKNELTVANQ